jgi:hypothetical protein
MAPRIAANAPVVFAAAGWSAPVPGRELHPLNSSASSRRTVSPTINGFGLILPNRQKKAGLQGVTNEASVPVSRPIREWREH